MATLTANRLDDTHIGPAPHVGRNVGIALAILVLAALATVYMVFGRRADAREAQRLEAFASTFAAKCDPDAIGPITPLQRHAFVQSDALQATIEKQLAALEAGGDCRAVYQALRAADFPLPPLK